MFQSILIAVDGSEPSKRALEAGCQLARAFGGEIHLVHALENDEVEQAAGALKSSTSPVVEAAIAQARAAGVSPSSTTVCEGDPFEEILTVAGLYAADIIVTGRRGLGNIRGLFAGSTSQQIAKHASCAFLSVK